MSRRAWRRVAEAAALLALAAFVVRYLARHAAEVRHHAWALEAGPLAGATGLAAAALLTYGALWVALVRLTESSVGARRALPIWFVANLARYAPGKIWQFSGMAYLARRRGVRALPALAASVLLQLIVVVTGVLLLGALVPAELARTYGTAASSLVLAGALVAAGLLLSPLFDRVAAAGLRRLGAPGALPRLPVTRKLAVGAGAAAAWVAYGLAFWLFLRGSVGQAPPPAAACGVFIAGYLAGFLAFFAPGGLGVREGVIVVLLQPWLSAPVALAAALLSRVWLTLVEVLMAGLTLLAAGPAPRAVDAGTRGGAPADG